jgi:universal stress protein E
MGRILVIADLGDSCCATPRGLELAARLDLDVDVVAFAHAPLKTLRKSTTEEVKLRELLIEERRKAEQDKIDRYVDGQRVNLEVIWEKDVARWVTMRCKSGRYSIVLKTGNRTESVIHSSTDWQLLRECPAPVLIVAKKKWHRARPVLAALDLSSTLKSKQALNHKVLGEAKALADALEVELKIITAVEIPALLHDLDLVDPISFVAQAKEDMAPIISRLAAAHHIPEGDFFCKRGPVERVITSQAAKVRAQVLVMGTVARKGVRARLLGNTAEKVLRHLKTDVLALKP